MKKIMKKKTSSIKKSLPVNVVKKPKENVRMHVLVIGNVLAFIAVLVVNYLAVTLPLGGMTTGALADLYPNLFTPAGLTFSIWGLIYLAIFGFVIWQVVDFYKRRSKEITVKIGIWFLLSCAANIGRMFAWQYQQVFLSVLIMIAFLVILIILGNKIKLGQKIGKRGDKLLVQIPFSLYLGRISVAIIANIAARLVHIGRGMRGMTDIYRTNFVIIIATLLTLRQLYKKYNIIFALVVIRAFIGIIIKRVGVDPVYASSIIRMLGTCIAIITAGIGWRWEKRNKN